MIVLSVYKVTPQALAKLMEQYTLVAPVMVDDKLVYDEVKNVKDIILDDQLPYKSPKEVVFPRVEHVMRFLEGRVEEAQIIKTVLLLGAKPCDAAAMKVLDEVFTGEKGRFQDSFYLNRRNSLTVVGMGCIEKKPGCFCEERGTDMTSYKDCDGFLRLDDGDIMYQPLTEKGAGLFPEVKPDTADSFPVGSPATTDPASETTSTNLETLTQTGFLDAGEGEVFTPTIFIDATEGEVFTSMPWEKYAEGCIGCGTCTYLCPTCHCFNLRDSEEKGTVTRTRLWDSCMYPKFTLHAGGHNPRAEKFQRFRQRVLHKYLYIPENYGYTACYGCGRCIRSCPGGLNIKRTVADIMRRLEEAKRTDEAVEAGLAKRSEETVEAGKAKRSEETVEAGKAKEVRSQ